MAHDTGRVGVYLVNGEYVLGEVGPERMTLWQRIKKHGLKARIF